MEDLIIPSWAVYLFSIVLPIILGWLLWLTNKSIHNDKAIAINTSTDQHFSIELRKIYEAIKSSGDNVNVRLDKMDNRLDSLISNEMQFLKSQIGKK